MISSRPSAHAILDLCDSGVLDSRDVLENVLMNFLDSDMANEFAESEYSNYLEDDETSSDESEEFDD